MSFLYPIYFLGLLGLLPLIAIYFLKVRPRRKAVTAFFLWQAVFDQKKNTALFNRLRDLLSLLLMALAFLALILALTAPELASDQRKDLLLIIDNSASMATVNQGRSRLQRAREVAADIVKAMTTHQQAAVATVSLDLDYQSHFTSSPKTLLNCIEAIEPSDCPLRPQSLTMLTGGGVSTETTRILLLSDGCVVRPDANDIIELIKIGSDQENVGFVSTDIQMLQRQPVQVRFYYRLASTYDESQEVDLVLRYGNAIVKVIPVTVKPGVNEALVTTIDGGGPGRWHARLDVDDGLVRDNEVSVVVHPKQPVTVQVASEDRFFLGHSVLAFAETSGDLAFVEADADVVLAKGTVPDHEKLIVFAGSSDSWCGQVGEVVDNVIARVKRKDHPILKHCDIETLPFIGAREVNLPAQSQVIAETTDQVPLIYGVRDAGRTAVVFNMDPVDSEFYYSAWFPVLVYNSVQFLMGRQTPLASNYPVGDLIPIPALPGEDQATTVTVNDANDPVTLAGSTYGPVRVQGFHDLVNTAGQWCLGVNLLAQNETLVDNNDVNDTSGPINRGWPLSVLLAVLAFVLLLTECLLYHRRKVG